MKILVTGASGFIGAHVTERLVSEGVETAVLLRPRSQTWRIAHLFERVRCLTGDMSDPPSLRRAFAEWAADAVIHLGWSGVLNRQRNDLSQIDDNLWPTLHTMRIAGEAGCKTWIGIGSQAEYGPANCRLDENAPTRPTTTYGAVKLSTMLLGERIAAQYGVRFAWLRVFSTYGPKDNPEWMIPCLTRMLLEGNSPNLTACRQRWDYLYVADAAEAICRVALYPKASGVFNLGSGTAVELRTLVETIRDRINPKIAINFGAEPYRPDQVMHLEANVNRLREVTGWAPRTPFETGIAAVIDWERQNLVSREAA
jgi:nucleoside-diphosphate-sugar epimerase